MRTADGDLVEQVTTMSISEAVPEMELSSAQAEDVSVPPSLSAANSPSGPVVALADVQLDNGRVEVESTVGGTLTCSICMLGSKSHLAVPCGHQCACEDCAAQMKLCPVCRTPVAQWVKVHVA
jgi:hypothetical protein